MSSVLPPLDATRLHAALPERMRTRVQVCAEVASTQQPLLDTAATGADRRVLVTDRQTAGRGRRGRAWQSPPGTSLALSMLARAPEGVQQMGGVSLALGVAAAQALQQLGVSTVRLKWPNDLVAAGNKLGGILVESRGAGVVAGIGINMVLPESLREAIGQPCTDLAEQGCTVSREAVAAALILAWDAAFDLFLAQGLAPFLPHWQMLDALAGAPVRVFTGQAAIEGLACGIDAQGRLQVDVNGQRHVFCSAEVSVRRACSS